MICIGFSQIIIMQQVDSHKILYKDGFQDKIEGFILVSKEQGRLMSFKNIWIVTVEKKL